jgi:heme exporter protein D
MEATNHLGFIVAAYAVTAIVIAALIAWVMLDYRTQQRTLVELDKRGVSRRSAPPRPMEQAKEKA